MTTGLSPSLSWPALLVNRGSRDHFVDGGGIRLRVRYLRSDAPELARLATVT
jgi:hypothetical protein